jgi:hypothetical protein
MILGLVITMWGNWAGALGQKVFQCSLLPFDKGFFKIKITNHIKFSLWPKMVLTL